MKSPYNVGYWSQAAENWFLTRLSKIRSGEAVLFPAKKWRDVLRSGVIGSKLRNAVENHSTDFLRKDYHI